MTYEVENPILNSPFKKPDRYWFIREGQESELRNGRRPSIVYPPQESKYPWSLKDGILKPSQDFDPGYELTLVNRLREEVDRWQQQDYPGASRITSELLHYWNNPERERRLFFTQIEAVTTIIFLIEARADFRQGIQIPKDSPTEQQRLEGAQAFIRYCNKMATGSGKTTVMGMLAAWSILNKVNDRQDKRFSDVVLIVCPNVTIRDRLRELDPNLGEASLYRTRELVPSHFMDQLRQGKILVTNWHKFERQAPSTPGNDPAKVVKVGVPVTTQQTIRIGTKNDTARGQRYLTQETLDLQIAQGLIDVLDEQRDKQGNLEKVTVRVTKYLESEAAWDKRVLGQDIGNKGNILILNDEAHHAYRIQPNIDEDAEEDDDEIADYDLKESTIWVEGLDRIHKRRGINFCVDLSATPYYLQSAGTETHKPFPWVVSDFSLMDAIESGLVKIPQLAIRDTTGAEIPGYFNIWKWIMERMTAKERGGSKVNPKPDAVLKYAQQPITMLGSHWETTRKEWEDDRDREDLRPPVLILVCKNTNIAKVVYEWLAENKHAVNVPDCLISSCRNTEEATNTIRVDSKVVEELESGNTKTDETKWMRFTLDTVGRAKWPTDAQERPIYPEGFEALAQKLARHLHPPGRDIRCIVSVGMLTEGWDCNSVTHIIGLRPFMSQLLCEQVVGRALRRMSYVLGEDDRFDEELAKVFGVPFEIIPFKADSNKPKNPQQQRIRIYAVPAKAQYELKFPRVEGYKQKIRNRVAVDWDTVATIEIDPFKIPPEVQVKAALLSNKGRPSLSSPGALDDVNLKSFRQEHRFQDLTFDLAKALTQTYVDKGDHQSPPAHVLFPQLLKISDRYLREKVKPIAPCELVDVFLSPYYGWVVDHLTQAIRPDTDQGEAPEIPRYERHRGDGSTSDINFWTSRVRLVREVIHSHTNFVVANTLQWEQAAAYIIDNHPGTAAFVKNEGMNLTIPYMGKDGQLHDYYADFLIKHNTPSESYFILETKGYDLQRDLKRQAGKRWVDAVNADGRYGFWQYEMCGLKEVSQLLDEAFANSQ